MDAEIANCQHCATTGTCTTGSSKSSCNRCIAAWAVRYPLNFEKGKDYTGLVCSICWGRGIAEPSERKWDYRFPAFLASGFVLLGFLLLFLGRATQIPAASSLPFVGTLVGSITGFYFGGSKRSGDSKPATPAPQSKTPVTAPPDPAPLIPDPAVPDPVVPAAA